PLAARGALAKESRPVPRGAALRHRAGDLLPRRAAHHAVGAQTVASLEAAHGVISRAVEVPVHRHAVGLGPQDPMKRLDVAAAVPEVERPGAVPRLLAAARIPAA